MTPLNDQIVNSFDELGEILTQHGEHFRAKAYKSASEAVRNIGHDIVDVSQLKNVKGLGKTMLEKIIELQKTGTIQILEKERKNPMTQLTKVFGIGPKKAKELIDKGIDSIEKLKEVPSGTFTANITKGIKYFDDIQERIPRAEIDTYQKKLQSVFEQLPINNAQSASSFEIVGSYRRGAETSGDIDIIFTSTDIANFNMFLDTLIQNGIIADVLTRGKTKSMCIAQLPGQKYRRMDLLYAPPDEYAFSILYFTGSKLFNTIQRHRALQKGYSLNEHALTYVQNKEKVVHKFSTEKDIFDFLKMKYIKPSERTNAANVIYL